MTQEVETTVEEIYWELNDSQSFEMICRLIDGGDFDIEKFNNGEYDSAKISETYAKNRDIRGITLCADDEIEIEDVFDDLSFLEKSSFVKHLSREGWAPDSDDEVPPLDDEFNRKVFGLIGSRLCIRKEKEKQLLDFIEHIYD